MFSSVKNLKVNDNVVRYFKNSLWMLVEYVLRMFSAVFVGIYIARYLGPSQFGVLSYALAIVAFFIAISRIGLDSILVRDLVNHPDQRQTYMGTAFGLMLAAALVSATLLIVSVIFFEDDTQTQICILIISVSLLFQMFSVVDYGFQAQVQAKYSAIAKSFALAVGGGVKVYLVFIEADVLAFAASYVVDHAVTACFLLMMHVAKKQQCFIFNFDAALVRSLLKSSWPMALAAGASMLYMRVDQVMIKVMLGTNQLGLYAAATKVYEGWIVVPYVISVSVLPAIVKLKSSSQEVYEKNIARLFALVFWPSVAVAGLSTLYGDLIIKYTFGEAYTGSTTTLKIVMWTAAFTALGSVTTRFLTAEGLEKKIAFRVFVALTLNVVLNFILIPIYGIEGAAVSTLICVVVSMYLIDVLDSELAVLVRLKNKAMTFRF